MGAPRKETLRHQLSFEIYWQLGATRSCAEVARRVHASAHAVRLWSDGFKWQERIAQRKELLKELAAQGAIEDEAQSANEQLAICRAIRMKFVADLRDGKAGISASDFVKASQHEALLRGRPTERSEIKVNTTAMDTLIERIVTAIEGALDRAQAPAEIRGAIADALGLIADTTGPAPELPPPQAGHAPEAEA